VFLGVGIDDLLFLMSNKKVWLANDLHELFMFVVVKNNNRSRNLRERHECVNIYLPLRAQSRSIFTPRVVPAAWGVLVSKIIIWH